jgi:hypothetical protein
VVDLAVEEIIMVDAQMEEDSMEDVETAVTLKVTATVVEETFNFQNCSNNETNWMEQSNGQQHGTPQDHYHYNNNRPQGGGGWQAGSSSNRVLHIKTTITITTTKKGVGDNEEILRMRQWTWKLSHSALSTMHMSCMTKMKWKKVYVKILWKKIYT